MFKIAVCGFRGSGKTTLINQIIERCLPTGSAVVLENDAGEVQVAASTNLRKNIKTITIDSGCICCQSRDMFRSVINQLSKTSPADMMLIEPSGLASVKDIQGIDGLSADLTVLVIDVNRYHPLRQVRGDLFLTDIRLSPIIYLTHTQSFDGLEAIKDEISSLNPGCRILSDDTEVCSEITGLMESTEAPSPSYRKIRQ